MLLHDEGITIMGSKVARLLALKFTGAQRAPSTSRISPRFMPMVDIDQLRKSGWVRVNGAVPISLCDRLVDVLESELGVPVHGPSRWDAYGGEMRDLVPIWGHQAQWDIRQHPNLHYIWTQLWGTEKLCVSLDSCRFTPPWQPSYAEPGGIHWDHDPGDAAKRMFQGVVALTDTAADQGGFRCVPSLHRDLDA